MSARRGIERRLGEGSEGGWSFPRLPEPIIKEDVMANFLYIFRGDTMKGLSPAEMEANMNQWRAWMGQLSQAGHFKGGDPLGPGGRVLTGKKKAVTDGPFGETKDLVGGYLVVTAANLDEATELARGCPIFERDGSVEVREARAM
jgi:hypothetical protein